MWWQLSTASKHTVYTQTHTEFGTENKDVWWTHRGFTHKAHASSIRNINSLENNRKTTKMEKKKKNFRKNKKGTSIFWVWGASSSSTLYGIRQNSWAGETFFLRIAFIFFVFFFKRTSVSRWRSIRERTSTAETSSSRCWQIHFLWIRVRAGCGSSPPSPTLASHSKRVGPWSSSSSSSSDHIQAPKRREREKDEVGTSKQTKKKKVNH